MPDGTTGTEQFTITPPADGSNPVTTTTTTETTPVVVEKKKIYLGGRAFDSEEDALAYASQKMEQPAQTQNHVMTEDEVDPSKILFEDPATALRLMKEQTKKELRGEYSAAEEAKKVWDNFYAQNPDLAGFKDLVEGNHTRKFNDANFKGLTVDKGLEVLAKETRSQIARAKGGEVRQEKLNSNGVTTASPSGAASPKVAVTAAKPSTFTDELKALREKRKKAV